MPSAPKTFRLTPKPAQQGKSAATIERCRKYRTKGWASIRDRIIARDGMQCQLCQGYCIGKGNAHVDHVTAVADGGADDEENLRLLCASCHSKRTSKDQRR